jgi:hypothetical protein
MSVHSTSQSSKMSVPANAQFCDVIVLQSSTTRGVGKAFCMQQKAKGEALEQ